MALYYTLPAHVERTDEKQDAAARSAPGEAQMPAQLPSQQPASAVNFTGVNWQAYGSERGAPRRAPGAGFETERNREARDDRAYQTPKSGMNADGLARSDDEIQQEINARLANHSTLGISNILVNVIEGKVALFGAVDSHEAKRLAGEICQGVSGVIDIQNELRITDFR